MFDRLIKLVREEKVSLFIGAGFSIKAQAPSVSMLCDAILAQLDNEQQREEHKNDSLPDLAEFYVEDICCGSRNSLIDCVQNLFYFEPANMDDHQALAKIPHFHNIFTTNYDTLLEDSYEKKDCQVIRKDIDCTYIDKSKPVRVFKIHGDFVNQDFVVITANDFKNFFKSKYNPLMWNVVKQEFLTKHILFIGYSLSDDNIIDIIKNISKSVNKNQKDMHLIAPGINRGRQGQLKKMKVHYYDAYASDFLKELTKELDANIGMDFRHHKVSPETFNRYCNLHGFNPDIALKTREQNDIVNYKALPGHSLNHQLQMTLKAELKDILEEQDFEKNGIIANDTPFPNIPVIKLAGEDLLKCTHSVNGIVVQNEIAQVLVSPVVNETVLNIRIPSRSFMEKITAKSYRVKKGKAMYELDCHIYTVNISAELKDSTEEGTLITYNFNFNFRDTYTNNSEAIKWIDFISAFFSGEVIDLSGDTFPSFNTKQVGIPKQEHNFEIYKKYYQNIKQIELLTNGNFIEYNVCTEELYKISNLIIAYLTHQPVIVNTTEHVQFTANVGDCSDFAEEMKEKNKCISVVSTEIGGKSFTLNGRTFDIPFTHTIFDTCFVKSIKKKRKKMKIDFESSIMQYKVLFSDKSSEEEFPGLKPLEELKTT